MIGKISAVAAVMALIGSVLVTQAVIPGPEPAAADIGAVNLLFTAPGSPARYGANQVVALEAGNINFVPNCEDIPGGTSKRATPGVPDRFQPFADIYIVPAGASYTNNASLTDAAGAPNTVHGGLAGSFLYEPLAQAGPDGKVKSGTYGIVVDECQNKVFDVGEDTYIDNAFRVDVRRLRPCRASRQAHPARHH